MNVARTGGPRHFGLALTGHGPVLPRSEELGDEGGDTGVEAGYRELEGVVGICRVATAGADRDGYLGLAAVAN